MPVILSYGPMPGLAFQDGYPSAWQRWREAPDVTAGSSISTRAGSGRSREWVPHDYAACARFSRAGCSPGFIDHFSPREYERFLPTASMGRSAPWSNGKSGSTAFRITESTSGTWRASSAHLAAMCI